jgi:hypothetical protein
VKSEDIDVHTSISGYVGFCSTAKDGKVKLSFRAGGGERAISEDKRQAEVFILILEANNPTRERSILSTFESGCLQFTSDGAVVSSADITPTANGSDWEI